MSALRRQAVTLARSTRRSYATHAPISISQTSGFRIAVADEGKPTSTLSLVLKAGSRYESAPGLAHVLKNLVFKATDKRSALSLVREAELMGGVLTTSLSREHLILTAEFLRGDEAFFAELLGDVLTCSKFAAHEYSEEVIPQVAVEYEQAIQDPSILAFDLAHQVAFRKGLGNSLFASPYTAVPHEQAVSFATSSFAKPSEIVVIANSVPSKSLTDLVGEFFVTKSGQVGAAATATSVGNTSYYGGEMRVPTTTHGGSEHGHLLVAFKGASRQSPEYTVLQHLLGGQSSIRWSKGTSPLNQLASGNASARAFNLAYSDGGLFGIYVAAPIEAVEGLMSKALGELQKIAKGANSAEVKKAIVKAKFAAAAAMEAGSEWTEALGSQVLATGSVSTMEDISSSLEKVTAAKVSEAAASALKSRPTTVAVGDTHKMPYADAFKL